MPRLFGNSTYTNELGCPDDDGDGRANMTDPFPQDATEWKDTDQDVLVIMEMNTH